MLILKLLAPRAFLGKTAVQTSAVKCVGLAIWTIENRGPGGREFKSSTHLPVKGRRSRHVRVFASLPKLAPIWPQSAAWLDRSGRSVRDRVVRGPDSAGRDCGLRCRR